MQNRAKFNIYNTRLKRVSAANLQRESTGNKAKRKPSDYVNIYAYSM